MRRWISPIVPLSLVVVLSFFVGCATPSAPAPTQAPPPSAPAKPAPTTAPAKPIATSAPPTAAPRPTSTAPTVAPTSPPAKALENVTLRFSFGASGYQSPYYLALEKGYFRDAGINAQLMDGTGSATAVQSVAGGNDTFGEADAGTLINFAHQGVPVKMFATMTQRSPMGIISLAETGITKPKDLEGKRLAQSAESAATVIFPAFAAANGLDVGKITNVNMPIPATLAALTEKRVDATVGFLSSVVVPLEARGFKLNVLYYADLGVNTLNVGLFATTTLIQQKPDLVRRFAGAAVRGWDEASKNPDEAIKAFLKRKSEGQQENIARGQLKVFLNLLHTPRTQNKPVGFGDPQDWEDTINVLLKAGMIKERRPVGQYFTNEFLPTRAN